jgi:thioredoxin-related protein
MQRFSTVLIALFLCFSSQGLFAQEQKNGLLWYTDALKAGEVSKKSDKPIFAFFTGSDWCGWCHRMEQNVFDKPGFKEWAKANVILLELDFPHNKKLPDELQQQNNALQQAFKVQGFPTVWMFYMSKDTTTNNVSIAAMGSLGYPQAEAGKEVTAFLDNANKILQNKVKH